MRFLIVKEHLEIGGAETLAIRMCNWLCRNGHEVVLLTEIRCNELRALFHPEIRYFTVDGALISLLVKNKAKQFLHSHHIDAIDVVFVFSPQELAAGVALHAALPRSKLLVGVYHPDAYISRIRGNRLLRVLVRRFFLTHPVANLVFANPAIKKSHENFFRYSFQGAKIWPLPIDRPVFFEQVRRNKKVISIGNLKEFKSYNLSMIDVVAKLAKRGYDISYDIYGRGPLYDEINTRIRACGVQGRVRIHDQVFYTRFNDTVQLGEVFVGMGTSVVEAAGAGVPSIVAVVGAKDGECYGFVQDVPPGALGEVLCKKQSFPLEEVIARVFDADEASYIAIKKAGYDHVEKHFDGERLMQDFAKYAFTAKDTRRDLNRFYSAILMVLVRYELFKNKARSWLRNANLR